MSWWTDVLQVLSRPFPEESAKTVILIDIGVALFVTFFLFVFQPFGTEDIDAHRFLICLGFGVVGFLAAIFFEFLIAPLVSLNYSGSSMTFGKWIIYMFGILIVVSLGNFLYARLVLFGYIDWQFLPDMIYGTLMVGFFPITVIGWFLLRRREKHFQNIAQEINVVKSMSKEVDEASFSIFDINVDQIRYVQAFQNYIRIGHVKDQETTELVERATLKSFMDQLQGNTLVRCHRSYIVNRNAIISSAGNAQGLMLTLKQCDRQIPVSRSYVTAFRRVLTHS